MMRELIHFDTDFYRRDALEITAEKYQRRARVELTDAGAQVVASLEPLAREDDSQALRDEFCNDALSATAKRLRDLSVGDSRERERAEAPPWGLLAPYTEGAALGRGWVIESLSPIRAGVVTMRLRHAQDGVACVTICRNSGAPRGVAYTHHLDFLLMNGGGGTAQTEDSLATVLAGLADTLSGNGTRAPSEDLLGMLASQPSGLIDGHRATDVPGPLTPIAHRIEIGEGTICFDLDEGGISRPVLYDSLLAFADRCCVFLTRSDTNRLEVRLKARRDALPTFEVLARDVTEAIDQAARQPTIGAGSSASDRDGGLPPLLRPRVDMDALLAELDAADPATFGLGFQPERGPAHPGLRVLNVRGTGPCNSECLFCIEKFDPNHRPMPKADATRQLILDSAGQYDMLFFASGEPTIHPKLFEYVELGKRAGFTCFGMSSHFRTLADSRFTLKILEAGFEYFDIALHAADARSQLDINPIDDGGYSLLEALKGLAVLYRLSQTLGIRISVTHKIVISRLNVTRLEPIFRATYDRGVRHFILQPVRTLGLAPERQAKLNISEEGILPHLNQLLRRTEGLGAVVKPYGFSRHGLVSASHIESEQNRLKNVYGRVGERYGPAARPIVSEERPTDGRHWVEVRQGPDRRCSFASDGSAPVLDDALQRGLDLEFGCRMGSCGMCCGRLLEGRVDQSSQIFLTDEQIRQGFVLMCQARPLSDVVLRACTEDEIDKL